jgi:hypothetical protein
MFGIADAGELDASELDENEGGLVVADPDDRYQSGSSATHGCPGGKPTRLLDARSR